MDRKSKQKIRGLITLSVFLLISITILFGASIGYENKLREEQRQELEVIYPEIESELQENFAFYQKQSAEADRIFFMIEILFIMLCFSGILMIWKSEKREQEKQIKDETELIYEQLQRFHQGEFQMLSGFDEIREMDTGTNIYEKLRELGYYFSDMKERVTEEENNTKVLITDISHQLKTPLASIRMCHELSRAEDLLEEERREFLETETREIQNLETLLDELVKLSRLENQMIQINPEKNSIRQTVTEAVSQVFMKAYEKQIEISLEMEKDAEIFHDRKWTAEALTNVLENAVKYSDTGTSITIRVSYLPANVLIEVDDEGMGIQEEELHKIFRRFYRGDRAKERVKDGAGVGLYLARSIIEQQGGTIVARRKQSQGTIFKIMLPLH